METYLLEWAQLLLRWLHVIVAIAWIGSSFYFVFLDSNLIPPQDQALKDKGVGGEMWAVHGGGFYNPQKYTGAPGHINSTLHWFYWESYATWLSGFALFSLLYLWQADTYLIDNHVFNWSPMAAGFTALAFLVGFWLAYDNLCRQFFNHPKGQIWVGILVLILLAALCWLANALYAGRAAFVLIGATIATTMTANVFFCIIPGQRIMVKALTAGEPRDEKALAFHGLRGKQRSVHNTYFTLPVLFAMLANHEGLLVSHPQRWLILFLMMFAGAAIRQFFVQKHAWHLGKSAHPWPYALVGVAIISGLVVALRPTLVANQVSTEAVSLVQVQTIVNQRCISCHWDYL
ncbi:MAG: hypothetical protein EBT70_17100 [Betaproteobacteria bacterium]|nr:hypothetical protein [Betaproteobacteria bacterium]